MNQSQTTSDQHNPAQLISGEPLPIKYLQTLGASVGQVPVFNGSTVVWGPAGSGPYVTIVNGHHIDLNITTDQVLPVLDAGNTYVISSYLGFNASTNLDTVNDVEIWTGPNKTGTKLLEIDSGNSTVQGGWSFLTDANKSITGYLTTGIGIQQTQLYLSVGVPQGTNASAGISIFGFKI